LILMCLQATVTTLRLRVNLSSQVSRRGAESEGLLGQVVNDPGYPILENLNIELDEQAEPLVSLGVIVLSLALCDLCASAWDL